MGELAGLRVCFVAGTLGQGGAERQLFYIIEALKDGGAAPRVLCLTRGEHWQKRIESLGVDVSWVGQSSLRAIRLLKIIAELSRHPTDVVQSQHFYTNLYVSAAARFLRLPEIGALRNDGIEEISANPGLLGRRSLTMPRMIAANSTAGIENAIMLGAVRNRLLLLPNAVDTSLFKPRSATPSEHVTLLTVARLVRTKRVDRFVHLLADVRRRTTVPINGIIAGDGPLRRELERQASAKGLDESVCRFLGSVRETNQLYNDASVLVVTSDREGTPNAVLEAMASGLPVVATRVGELSAIVRDGATGYTLDPGDEEGLARAVLSLIEDRAKRLEFGKNARTFVEQHYSLARLPDNLARLYRAVLTPKNAMHEPHKADSHSESTMRPFG